MKNLIVAIVAVVSSCAFANSTLVITSDSQLGAIVGFSDSSFNYDVDDTKRERSFCFIGNVSDVCGIVEAGVLKKNGEYYQGAHDRIELYSCKTVVAADKYETDSVTLMYNLSDDYGANFDVTRVIEACTRNQLVF